MCIFFSGQGQEPPVSLHPNCAHCVYARLLSCIWLFVTSWPIAHQAPLFMELSKQEHWSGLPFSPPGNLPDPGIETASLASLELTGGFFTTEPPGKPMFQFIWPHCVLGIWTCSNKAKVKVTQLCPTLCDSMDYIVNCPGQDTGVGSLSLL